MADVGVTLVGVQATFSTGPVLVIVLPNQTDVVIERGVSAAFKAGNVTVAQGPILTGVSAAFTAGQLITGSVIDGFNLDSLAFTTAPASETEALMTLYQSNTRGASWLEPRTQTLGGTGEYFRVLSFRVLGLSRSKMFRFSGSGNRPMAITGTWILTDEAQT